MQRKPIFHTSAPQVTVEGLGNVSDDHLSHFAFA